MNDIEHWLDDDAPADVAESLRAARAEAPRRATVERCLALVGVAGAVGLSSSLASAASYGAGGKAAGVAGLATWGLSGFAAGAVLMAGIEITERVLAPPRVAPPPAPSVLVSSTSRPDVPRAESAPVMSAAPPKSVAPSAPRPPSANGASSPTADERLAAELSLLSDVRAAIDRRDASTALILLEQHDRRYRASAQLQPEARYLRLEALELAGRRDEAAEVARRLLELDPRGPHSARARRILEKE
jgi:hypothetical protein